MSGFIKRVSYEFKNDDTVKALYTSLVRPIFEYCSPIWNPATISDRQKVERVRKGFLWLFLWRKANSGLWRSSEYDRLYQKFKLSPLEHRWTFGDLLFLHKFIKYRSKCPRIISILNLKVRPRNTRRKNTFAQRRPRINIHKNSNPLCG